MLSGKTPISILVVVFAAIYMWGHVA